MRKFIAISLGIATFTTSIIGFPFNSQWATVEWELCLGILRAGVYLNNDDNCYLQN